MKTAAIVAALALGACGDDLWHPTSLPEVVFHGGEVLHHVSLAAVAYAGDPRETRERAFAQFLIGSQWLAEVGAPYDVHGDRYLGGYEVARAAPATLTLDELLADLDATVPLPPGATVDGDHPLYLIYLPFSTTLTGVPWGVECTDWDAFHGWTTAGRRYAVMGDCENSGLITGTLSSHEIIEAATDADSYAWYADAEWPSPWAFDHEEVGDLCQAIPQYVHEGDFQLQRVWSIAAAAAPRPDPCVPVPDGDVWIDVDVDPRSAIVTTPADFTLTGWSSGPTDDWPLVIKVPPSGPPFVVTLSSPTIGDGKQVTMHVDLPPDASATVGLIEIWSGSAEQVVGVNYPPFP
jgi:hypothetical protein